MSNHKPKIYNLQLLLRNEELNNLNKLIKQYDGSNNKIYEKKTFPDSIVGDVALARSFQYDGSNNLLYSSVSVSTWTSDNETDARPVLTDISLSDNTILDGEPAGTKIADISTTGGVSPFYYEIIGDDDNMFRIDNDDELTLDDTAAVVDSPYTVYIRSTDANGLTYEKEFTITVVTYVNLKSTEFDGISKYVNVANPSTFHFESGGVDQPFSLSVWVKMVDATNTYLMGKGSTTNREYFFGFSSLDYLYFGIYTSDAQYIAVRTTSTYTADEGSWHNYTATYDGSSTTGGLKIYRDGVAIAIVAEGTGSAPMRPDIAGFTIGCFYNIGFTDGLLDESSVWNKKLSAAEVLELYNSGVPMDLVLHTAYANCLSWWRMGDGDTYPIISDQISINHGTMINMTAADFKTDVP